MKKEDNFVNFFNAFKNLEDDDKKEEIISLFKDNKELLSRIIQTYGLNNKDNIVNCLNNEDFLNEIFVYLNLERELLAEYILKKEGEM